jgi:SAM-dependent methyltransferase
LVDYYSRRAGEYDAIWRRADPQCQAEQAAIAGAIRESFVSRRVLEVACGTGYWTQFAAEVAEHICAIDASSAMRALARTKRYPPGRVTVTLADAYALAAVPGQFDAGLANFWLSHIPRARLEEFLDSIHRRVGPDCANRHGGQCSHSGPGWRTVQAARKCRHL